MKDRGRQIGTALAAWARRWWGIVALLGVLALAAYFGRDIPNYPAHRAAVYRTSEAVATAVATVEAKDRLAFEKDLLQYETDNQIKIWTGLVQAVGAVVLAIGGYFTWRNLRVAQEGQITNRFTQAIDQLGAEKDGEKKGEPNLEVRVGGIYALERIARDSPRDHWTIIEILAAYVRQNAPRSPSPASRSNISPWRAQHEHEEVKPRADIHAILTVLRRRTPRSPPAETPGLWRIDLRKTDLRGGHLEEAPLEEANLEHTQLHGAHLWKVQLQEARLGHAELQGAHLEYAELQGAHLEHAQLQGAHLDHAQLQKANLEHAQLQGANLRGAQLQGANLNHADFSTARGLTDDQIKTACSCEGTALPPNVKGCVDGSPTPPQAGAPDPGSEAAQPRPTAHSP